METVRRNANIILLILLGVSTAIVWYAVFYFESRQNLLVTFFDVGQGDAIFIEVPNGNQILIDGGPNDAVLAKLGRAMPFWDRSLDLLILTHPDADHLNGLLEVLRRYDVGMVLETGVLHSTPQYQEWRQLLEERGVRVVMVERGQRISFGRGAEMDILAPFENYSGKLVGKVNNTSIVGRFVHGENSLLLTGDIEKLVERRLVFDSLNSSFIILNSDVLKIPHHGSKTSSSEEFLRAVSPEVAIIQVGQNRYGHPTQEVLERLAAIGAKILRNDLDGDIRMISDSISYRTVK